MNKVTLHWDDYITVICVLFLITFLVPVFKDAWIFANADSSKYLVFHWIEKSDIYTSTGQQLITSKRETFETIKADFYGKTICETKEWLMYWWPGYPNGFVTETLNVPLNKTDGVQIAHTYVVPMRFPVWDCETTYDIQVHWPFGMRKKIPDVITKFKVYE